MRLSEYSMKIVRPEKTILTDADGVLLDWNYAFALWMSERGFHESGPREVYDRHIAYEMAKPEMRTLIGHFKICPFFSIWFWFIWGAIRKTSWT